MPYGYTVHHVEWLAEHAYPAAVERPAEFDVLLFDDSVDEIENTDDVEDIDTEPTDGNYARQSYQFDDLVVEMQADHAVIAPIPLEFDFTDTTGEVDSAGVVWAGADGAEHLMVRVELDDRYDLADNSDASTVALEWQLAALF